MMIRSFFTILLFWTGAQLFGQTSAVVNVPSAGRLKAELGDRAIYITELKVTGTVDARDFVTMRDEMPILESIDLSGATIAGYKGYEGTWYDPSPDWMIGEKYGYCEYGFNAIPREAFVKGKDNSVSKYYEGKPSLRRIVLPENLMTVEKDAFKLCSGIDAFEITALSRVLKSIDGVLYSADRKQLVLFPPAKVGEYEFPDVLEKISEGALDGCSFSLLKFGTRKPPVLSSAGFTAALVQVPSGCVEPYKQSTAFSEYLITDKLNSASVNLTAPGTLSERLAELGCNLANLHSLKLSGTFGRADLTVIKELSSLYLLDLSDADNTEIPDSAFRNNQSLSTVKLPSKLQRVGWSSFFGCINLTGKVELPESVTYIGGSAFQGTKLCEINFPAAITTIEGWAFRESFLKKADLSQCKGLSKVAELLFRDCKLLREVTLPPSLLSIGKESFYNTGIHSILFPERLQQIGQGAFCGCPVYDLKFPPTLQTIGSVAFSKAEALQKVDFADCVSLQEIGESAFSYAPILKEIDLSGCDRLTKIGGWAFCGDWVESKLRVVVIGQRLVPSGLEKICFPASLEEIGYSAFKACRKLQKADMTACNELRKIEESAFERCDRLPEISFPPSLTGLGEKAFAGCVSLLSVTSKALTPPVTGDNVFEGVDLNSASLILPYQTKAAYLAAPVWNAFKKNTEAGYVVWARTLFAGSSGNKVIPGVVSGTGLYTEGETVNLSARSLPHYKFTGWKDESGALLSTSEAYVFQTVKHRQVSAEFTLDNEHPREPDIRMVTRKKAGELFVMTLMPVSAGNEITVDWGEGNIRNYDLSPDLSDFENNSLRMNMPDGNGEIKIYGTGIDRLYVNSGSDYADAALTRLELLNCPSLTWLYCSENELKELDLSNSPLLSILTCSDNKLGKLDITPCAYLSSVSCWNNYLDFSSISARLYDLSEGYMDQYDYRLPGRFGVNRELDLSSQLVVKDGSAQTVYEWKDSNERTLTRDVDYTGSAGKFVFLSENPVPVYCILTNDDLPGFWLRTTPVIIDDGSSIEEYRTDGPAYILSHPGRFMVGNIKSGTGGAAIYLYDLNGKLLRKECSMENEHTLSTGALPRGCYLIRVVSDSRSQLLKVVKK